MHPRECHMTIRTILVAAACLAAVPMAHSADPSAPVQIDGRAERVLLDACAYLRSADRFSVQAEIDYDEVLKSGQKVQYSRAARVVLARPDRLRADIASDKGERAVYFDGRTVTVHRPAHAVYAAFAAPATVDAMLDAAEAKDVVIPLDDLLRTHPCAGLGEHLQKGTYAGLHYTAGDLYHHLLLETDAVDVQLWVGQGDAPEIRKLVITYRDAPGKPQYAAVLTDWNFAPAIDAATFTFTPPQGTKQVSFRGGAESQGGGK